MHGYKGMTKDMKCRGMQFEIGKKYCVNGDIELCKNGLHFCVNLKDVFEFYKRDGNRFFEIETEKEVISDGIKSVTSELKIIRELTDIEINRVLYGYDYGNGNDYGYGNCNGNGYGDGYGDGDGDGYGNGNGYSYVNGDGHGDGYGGGDGNGYGNGYGYENNIQEVLLFID